MNSLKKELLSSNQMTILGRDKVKKNMQISFIDEDIRIEIASPSLAHRGQLRPVNQQGK